MANKVSVLFEIDRDQQGRAVLRQIDRQLTNLGATGATAGRQIDQSFAKVGQSAQNMGKQVGSALDIFKGLIVVEFFRRGAEAALSFGRDSVTAFNQAQAAAIGLSSVAVFKGIEPSAATQAVKGLQVVRDGLLSVSEASKAVQNLLQTNFTLEQAITLINRLGDSAAFNRQASLGFGEAITRTTEGIRLGLSTLSDGAGVAQNLGQMLKMAGIEASELSNISQNAAARMAIFEGFIRETNAQVGNATKLTATFSGQLSKLEVTYNRLLQTLGQQIATNPQIIKGFEGITKSVEGLIIAAATPGSELNRSLTDLIDLAGKGAQSLGEMIKLVRRYADELSALIKIAGGLGVAFGVNKILGSLAGSFSSAAVGAVSEATASSPSIRGRNSALLGGPVQFSNRGGLVPFDKSSDALIASFSRASKTVLETDQILAAHKLQVAGATTAIGYMKQQVATASTAIKDFATGGIRPGFGAVAGIVGVIGPVIAEAITGAIRKAAEGRLATAEGNANLGLGQKSLADREAEFERLKALLTTPGFGGLGSQANVEFQIQQTGKILQVQRQVEEAKKIISEIERLRQEGAGINIGDESKGIPSIEQFLKDRGLPDFNEFSRRAMGSQSELDSLIGGQNLDVQNRLKAILSPSSSLIPEDTEKERKALEKLVSDVGDQIFQLQQKATFDPVAASIAETRKELEDFTKKFESLGPVALKTGQDLIKALGEDKAFKAAIGQAEKLANIFRSQAGLTGLAQENARADDARQFSFFQGQTSLQRELDLLRFGEEDPIDIARRNIRDAAGSLTGLNLAQAIQEATSGLSLEQLRGSGLDVQRRGALLDVQQAQRDQFNLESAREAALKEATARNLATAQSFLGRAGSDFQRQAALDAIISATSDTRLLNPEQIEARSKAMDEQIALIASTKEQELALTQDLIASTNALNETMKSSFLIQIEAPESATVDRLPRRAL